MEGERGHVCDTFNNKNFLNAESFGLETVVIGQGILKIFGYFKNRISDVKSGNLCFQSWWVFCPVCDHAHHSQKAITRRIHITLTWHDHSKESWSQIQL